MKRFTETSKYQDSWYRKLPLEVKAAWDYICHSCDVAGVWDADFELANFIIGAEVNWDLAKNHFGSRIHVMPNGKWWIVGFCEFQYGQFSDKCIPHKKVIELLKKHDLWKFMNGEQSPQSTLPSTLPARVCDTLQEEDKEEEEEEDKEKTHSLSQARIILHFLNEQAGRKFSDTETNLTPISARIKDVKGDLDGIKKMILRQIKLWKGGDMEEYLQPSTLFRASKFQEYYDKRELPASNGNYKSSISPQQRIVIINKRIEDLKKDTEYNPQTFKTTIKPAAWKEIQELQHELKQLERTITS